MDISTVILLIGAIGGLSGIFSTIVTAIFKIVDLRKEKKGQGIDAKLQPIINKLEEQSKDLDQIRGDTVRLQLSNLIHREPENVDTILRVAQFYFCDLGKNWWMASEFKKWARVHDVEIPGDIWSVLKKEH